MLKKSDARINYFNMEKDYQLITSTNDFTSLKSTIEENLPKKIVYGKSTHKEALKESEDFMKSIFKLHKIFYTTIEEIEEIAPDEENYSDLAFLEAYNKLGRKLDAYKLPIRITNTDDYWYGIIANPILKFEDLSLISKEKIMFNCIGLSSKATRLTGRIISHEITHSQIDSNKGATRHYHNYEVLPRFIELLHSTPAEDDTFFTNILIMLQEHSLLEKINYFKESILTQSPNLESSELYLEHSTYLISSLKAFNLYEMYLNSSSKGKQEIINQIQKIFDGKMLVEELLDKNEVSMEKGVESAKRLVKQAKRELL